MILIAIALICMITVPLTGGRLSRLAGLPLRWLWTAPAALLLQIAITELVPNANHNTLAAVHIVSYVLVIAFLVANRGITGAPIIAIGAISNALVIVLNGGVMAASAKAQHLAGLVLDDRFHNSVVLANPRLLFLGDIIPVPGPLPNVLSPGDCVIFLGLLVLLHSQCHRQRSEASEVPEVSEDGIVLSQVAPIDAAAQPAPGTYGSVLGINGLQVSAPQVNIRRAPAPAPAPAPAGIPDAGFAGTTVLDAALLASRIPDVLPRDEEILASQRIARLTWQAGLLGAAIGFVLNRPRARSTA
jgi:hypothetical protein